VVIEAQIGNEGLLKLRKTAFLCSRQVPASTVLKCYDWAIAQREAGTCVISGFHSTIEKDVLHYLLKGKQSIIIALARGLKERIEPAFEKPLAEGRLLFITPFRKDTTRVSSETATVRNEMMIDIADEITVGYASKGGRLEKSLSNVKKQIHYITKAEGI
jgi:hypothetical protein